MFNVAIVDDENVMHNILTKYITRFQDVSGVDTQLFHCFKPTQLIKKFKGEQEIDVVFLDNFFGGSMLGFDTLKEIKKYTNETKTTVILLTSFSVSEMEFYSALNDFGFEYQQKPISEMTVISKLNNIYCNKIFNEIQSMPFTQIQSENVEIPNDIIKYFKKIFNNIDFSKEGFADILNLKRTNIEILETLLKLNNNELYKGMNKKLLKVGIFRNKKYEKLYEYRISKKMRLVVEEHGGQKLVVGVDFTHNEI